jgi:hypothetical protein
MSVLDEIGIREGDLAEAMGDYVQRPARGGGGVRVTPAVMESIGSLVRGGRVSVEEAIRAHGIDPADLAGSPEPTCFEVGLNRPLCESEEDLDAMLWEMGERTGADYHADVGLTEPIREDVLDDLAEVLSEGLA